MYFFFKKESRIIYFAIFAACFFMRDYNGAECIKRIYIINVSDSLVNYCYGIITRQISKIRPATES